MAVGSLLCSARSYEENTTKNHAVIALLTTDHHEATKINPSIAFQGLPRLPTYPIISA